MENLTPPAAGQKRTGWSTASAGRAAGSGAAGTVAPGSVPAPAARHRNREQTPAAHDMHRDAPGAADRTASADRRPEQQRTTRRRPGLFLLPCLHAFPPARPAGSAARHALGVVSPRGKAGKYPGSAGHSAWILRPPPEPGRISAASAAPDDHAAHQLHRLPIAHRQQPAVPDLTAASASRLHLPAAPAHPAALPPACRSGSAPPTTAKRPKTSPPRPAAGGVRFFT